jgi:hypothetical protein
MSHLTIEKVNEVYLKITTEPHVEHELKDRFTFEVPGAKFMPQYRSKYWDGHVHLYNLKTKRIRMQDTPITSMKTSSMECLLR